MEYVVEVNRGRSSYEVVSIHGEVIRTVNPYVTEVVVSNKKIALFYDSGFNVVSPICQFFLENNRVAENTRDQAKSALRLLVAYCEIVSLPVNQYNAQNVRGFLDFLRGVERDGIIRSYRLTTMRSEATVGAYLKHIRSFCRYLKLENSPFLERKRRPNKGMQRNGFNREPYAITAKVVNPLDAPRHISLSEYRRLIFVANSSGLPGDVILIRLMFEHGMRRGECLGLALEDVKNDKAKDGLKRFYLILRDRPSDDRDQHAKTTMKVFNEIDCRTPTYHTKDEGFQVVAISENLYFALTEYIEDAHSGHSPENAKASTVDDFEDNRYVFLNTHGGRLRAGAWDKRLRKLYALAGIPIDTEVRKTNLSHRLRHGYGMTLRYECGFSEREIMILMRHKSIRSQEPYTRPTPDRIAQIQAEAIDKFETVLLEMPE